MNIANILRAAAEFLWDGASERKLDPETGVPSDSIFLCHAIASAVGISCIRGTSHPASRYLYLMGMSLCGAAFVYWEVDEVDPIPDPVRQEVRYAWLQFAADLWDEGFRPEGFDLELDYWHKEN